VDASDGMTTLNTLDIRHEQMLPAGTFYDRAFARTMHVSIWDVRFLAFNVAARLTDNGTRPTTFT
jgi:hypothetical protein